MKIWINLWIATWFLFLRLHPISYFTHINWVIIKSLKKSSAPVSPYWYHRLNISQKLKRTFYSKPRRVLNYPRLPTIYFLCVFKRPVKSNFLITSWFSKAVAFHVGCRRLPSENNLSLHRDYDDENDRRNRDWKHARSFVRRPCYSPSRPVNGPSAPFTPEVYSEGEKGRVKLAANLKSVLAGGRITRCTRGYC